MCGSRGPLGIQKSDDHGRRIHTVPLGNTKLSVLRACASRTHTRQMQAAAATLTALHVDSVCLYSSIRYFHHLFISNIKKHLLEVVVRIM